MCFKWLLYFDTILNNKLFKMNKFTIHTGKGPLQLTKSTSLVGLKTKDNKDISGDAIVKDKLLQSLGGFQVVKLEKEGNTIDEKLDEARQLDQVELGTHVFYTPGSKKALVPTGKIYLIFQEGTSKQDQQTILDQYYLTTDRRVDDNRVLAAVTAKSANPVKTASLLAKEVKVKVAEPDLDALLDSYDFVPPGDGLVNHLWHLQNKGIVPDNPSWKLKPGADARVVDAWKRLGNLGGSNIVVAVIDNGFDLNHPDLKGKLYKPFDLWTQSAQILQGDPLFTHGTPCAGVAIAPANGTGTVGVAPNAKFMPVSGTSFSLAATEQMFDYCIKNGADVISCSWGTTDPGFGLNALKKEAIARAATQGRGGKGCVICFAAGNEGLDYVNFYAALPEVICVSASTSQDEYASYANQGREVTICAPSNGDWPILAPRAAWDAGIQGEAGDFKWYMDGISRGDKYQHFGGTSSATPLVAGICALILTANPNLTAKEVKDILVLTADKIGKASDYVNGHSRKYGYGRINADRAVAEAIRRKDGSPVATTPAPVEPAVKSGQGLFQFSVKKQPSQGYGVQVGNYAAYGNVLIQVELLQAMFNQPVIVHINELSGKTVYRVIVGAFSKSSEALALLNKMKGEGVNGFVQDLKKLG